MYGNSPQLTGGNSEMKKFFKSIACLFVCLSVSASELPFSANITSLVNSKYLVFGNGVNLYDSPVLQTDLMISGPYGFYIDLWNSRALGGDAWDSTYGDEFDYGIGWSGKVWIFDTTLAVTYFDEPSVFSFDETDILLCKGTISTEVWQGLNAFGSFSNYSTVFSGHPYPDNGGFIIETGLNRTFSYGRFSTCPQVSIAYDDGSFGIDPGFILKGDVGLTTDLGKGISLIGPDIRIFHSLSVEKVDSNYVLYGGLGFSF